MQLREHPAFAQFYFFRGSSEVKKNSFCRTRPKELTDAAVFGRGVKSLGVPVPAGVFIGIQVNPSDTAFG